MCTRDSFLNVQKLSYFLCQQICMLEICLICCNFKATFSHNTCALLHLLSKSKRGGAFLFNFVIFTDLMLDNTFICFSFGT